MSDETTIPGCLVKATYHTHADDVAAFQSIVVRVAQGARNGAGCLFFEAAQNLMDPTLFHLIEGWASYETLAAHTTSDEFKVLLKEVMALRILDRSASLYFVSGVEDVPMPS